MPPLSPSPSLFSRRFVALAATLIVAVAGCAGSASPRPTTPPDATGSLVPVETATAGPSTSTAPAASPTATFPISLKDDEGTVVALAHEPHKIVSLTPAETEILFALGVGDRVVGKVEDVTPYPPAVTSIPDVAKFGEVDVERIVALGADLVVAGGNSFNPPDKIAQLRKLGVPVLVVYAPDLGGVLKDIELTGDAVGRPGEARDLTASMQAAFDQVQAATASLPKPRVFYELDATQKIYTAADDSFLAQEITLAGGTPITTGSKTSFEIPLESLVTANPDLILLGDAAYGTTAATVKSRPGPRLVDGLRALALAIHPGAAVPSPRSVPSPQELASGAPGASGSTTP